MIGYNIPYSNKNRSLLFNDVNNYLFRFFLFTYASSLSQNVRFMTLIVFEYVYTVHLTKKIYVYISSTLSNHPVDTDCDL
jgi:hypothetical protein